MYSDFVPYKTEAEYQQFLKLRQEALDAQLLIFAETTCSDCGWSASGCYCADPNQYQSIDLKLRSNLPLTVEDLERDFREEHRVQQPDCRSWISIK